MYSLLKWSLFRGHVSFQGSILFTSYLQRCSEFRISEFPGLENLIFGVAVQDLVGHHFQELLRPGQAGQADPVRGYIYYKWPKINGFHWGVDGVVTLLV